MNPYSIQGPALISFSGGRTSGYMLRKILDQAEKDGMTRGQLWPDVHVLFCNTGKEDNRTLDFVHACECHWNIKIHWLQYHRQYLPKYRSADIERIAAQARDAWGMTFEPANGRKEPGFVEVDYATAARTSDPPSKTHPFANFVAMSGVPNAATRMCSTELKVRVMKRWMLSQGYKEWTNIVGIRADEPHRVAKMRISPPERWDNEVPLADAGVTQADVLEFWRTQPFDLQLTHDPHLGTYEGNCDLCMLKAAPKKIRITQERPSALDWWEQIEAATGSMFNRDISCRSVRRLSLLPPQKNPQPEQLELLAGCGCHD
jgi:3'-phosphoadenosine 5'-phosphosulfate sulfotransferase (PAPS reductase)/FAD synthetase